MSILEILNVLMIGWLVGFVSFAFLDCLSMSKRAKKERARHDLEIARIKAVRSVTR